MFAFAILDRARHSIHLARDPLGKKPLFFRLADGELIFASSTAAVAAGMESTPAVDASSVDQLISGLYIPGPQTIFQGIEKLPPGCALSLGRDASRHDYVYWQPDFLHPLEGIKDEEWLERIESALSAAVKRRLVADVPLGILLSGGVDSSLVTVMAVKAAGKVRTFSAGTEDPVFDESRYAQAVAERYGTEHTVLEVRSGFREQLTSLVA